MILFADNLTALEISFAIVGASLLLLFLLLFLNCCLRCCPTKEPQNEENRESWNKNEEYYNEICRLLEHHRQMELRHSERAGKDAPKNDVQYRIEEVEEDVQVSKKWSGPQRSEKLTEELNNYYKNHNVKIRQGDETEAADHRRTWTGLDGNGKFKPVRMPEVTEGEPLKKGSPRNVAVRYMSRQSYETTV